MKVRVGLIAHSSAWEQLCGQEGVSTARVDLTGCAIAEECSVLVVNKQLHGHEREILEQYIAGGGGVIGYTHHLQGIAGVEGVKQDLRYLVGEQDQVFPSVQLLDLAIHGMVPRGANTLRTDVNTMAVRAGDLQGGCAVILPFDVEDVFHDSRAGTKDFYSPLDRLPSERVSLVAKGELRHLIRCALSYLHHVRGIPYVHLWYFPNSASNVFAFRVDSDAGSREEVDALHRMGSEHGVPISWFLDVKSHEGWLEHFRFFADQEIGLHCYEHQTYTTYEGNRKNIAKALQEMHRRGLEPSGFASPFGIWNPQLGRAIDEAGFEYSSEFSFAYDTLPLVPEAEGIRFKALQVPVHPICIGSLRKAGYSDARMSDYFGMVARQKIARQEPLFFYHHPSHHYRDVVERILSLGSRDIENVTLGAYARWWKRREGVQPAISVMGDKLEVRSAGPSWPDDVWLRIAEASGKEVITPFRETFDLRGSLQWTTGVDPVPTPPDIRRIREFDPRTMVGSMYDSLLRKLQ